MRPTPFCTMAGARALALCCVFGLALPSHSVPVKGKLTSNPRKNSISDFNNAAVKLSATKVDRKNVFANALPAANTAKEKIALRAAVYGKPFPPPSPKNAAFGAAPSPHAGAFLGGGFGAAPSPHAGVADWKPPVGEIPLKPPPAPPTWGGFGPAPSPHHPGGVFGAAAAGGFGAASGGRAAFGQPAAGAFGSAPSSGDDPAGFGAASGGRNSWGQQLPAQDSGGAFGKPDLTPYKLGDWERAVAAGSSFANAPRPNSGPYDRNGYLKPTPRQPAKRIAGAAPIWGGFGEPRPGGAFGAASGGRAAFGQPSPSKAGSWAAGEGGAWAPRPGGAFGAAASPPTAFGVPAAVQAGAFGDDVPYVQPPLNFGQQVSPNAPAAGTHWNQRPAEARGGKKARREVEYPPEGYDTRNLQPMDTGDINEFDGILAFTALPFDEQQAKLKIARERQANIKIARERQANLVGPFAGKGQRARPFVFVGETDEQKSEKATQKITEMKELLKKNNALNADYNANKRKADDGAVPAKKQRVGTKRE